MKVLSKVFKRKVGRNKGAWVLRLQYQDETGRTRYIERHAESKSAANDLRFRLVDDIKKTHGNVRTGDKMTFSDLVDYCRKHFYTPAEYSDGRRISGVRSVKGVESALKALQAHFGRQNIRTIYKASIQAYKEHRLKTPIVLTGPNGESLSRQRKVASVNRELAVLRRMLKVAFSEGWILKDPFIGSRVISVADENTRERILTRAEEVRLLNACANESRTIETHRYGKPYSAKVQSKRGHLHALIILALDTGMRRGELFKLRWEDVDFDHRTIRVRATHTKTQRERLVPLTLRSKGELIELGKTSTDDRIFPFADVKKAFSGARKDADLDDVRFHDLRHTAITRMVQGGISVSEVGKIAGHSQLATTYRYINTDGESIREAANVMDRYFSSADVGEASLKISNSVH